MRAIKRIFRSCVYVAFSYTTHTNACVLMRVLSNAGQLLCVIVHQTFLLNLCMAPQNTCN